MSHFNTIANVSEGQPGTAPNIFIASTQDNLGAITAVGYLNDLYRLFKANDIVYVNYSDTASVFPMNPGLSATFGAFQVVVSGGNTSLVATAFAAGVLLAANNLSDVASAPAALANLGVHSAKATGAGGSATVTITDASISAASVVVAAIQSSANAVSVEKVTPGAGSLVVLLSGDPGANVISYVATAAAE